MANRFPLVFDAAGDKQIKELPTGDNLNLLGSSIVDVVNVNASGTIVADTLTVNNINASGGSIAAVAISNDYADLDNRPTLFSGDYNDLTNLPTGASNAWADITDKPIIPSALSQLVNDANFASENDFVVNAANIAGLNASYVAGLATVATTGSFTDLLNVPNYVTAESIADGTLTIDVNNTGDLNGRLIADDADRVAYDHVADRFPNPKIDGEIQFIGAGNDALTKISASDGRVVAESLGTRGLNLRAYNPLSSTWSDNGVNLAVNIDQAIFTQSRQLRISDAGAGSGSQSVTILGGKYTFLGDDNTWTKLYLGGLSDAPETIGGIIPAEKSHIFRFTKGWFETLDTDALIVNNDIELKGHITSNDSSILVDTEQGKFFGSLEGDVVGSVFADDSSVMVDSVNNRINGTVTGDIDRVGSALGITSDSGINLVPGGFLSIPNATTFTAAASDTISLTATNTLTLASNTGKVKITSASVPVTSIGVAGDEQGMIAFNGSYIYYCTADHDSITNIWKRIAWSGDTW